MGQETGVHAVRLFLRRSDPLHLGGMHHVHSSAELPQQVVNPTGRTSRFHGDAEPTGEVVLEGAFQALRRCGNHAVFDPLALPILDMDVGRLPRDIEAAVVHANLPTVTVCDPTFRLQGGAETVIADQLAGWHPSYVLFVDPPVQAAWLAAERGGHRNEFSYHEYRISAVNGTPFSLAEKRNATK